MVIGIPKETLNGENRIGVTPSTVKDLIKNDFQILIESDAGIGSFINNESYQTVGAKIVSTPKEVYDSSDMIVKVNPPNNDEDAPHEFLECHCTWDLDEDGYEEPYVITIHKDTLITILKIG